MDHGPRLVASESPRTIASSRWTWKSAAWAILQRRNHRQNGEFPGAGFMGNAEWMLLVLPSLGIFFLKRDSWGFLMFEWWNDDFMGWYFGSVTHVGYCSFYSDVSQFVQYQWWTLMVFVKFSLRIPRSAKKPVDGEILTHKALLWIAVHHSMQQVLQY